MDPKIAIWILVQRLIDRSYHSSTHTLTLFALQWVRSLDVPVRIFHAVVDPVCPLYGAKKLVEDVKKSGKDDIDIVIWEEEGLGHIGISTTESFPKEIKRFADSVRPKKKL